VLEPIQDRVAKWGFNGLGFCDAKRTHANTPIRRLERIAIVG